ncbi:MAG TPA: phosphoadenylyl-sulfate reductase [Vicinamibacterales bacterium]|nr:phosphoadenylyl-sulfate reductase [Vicinamibacterales bacterium]
MSDYEQIIDEQLGTAERHCITSSFQADCMVLLHMVLRRKPHIPVLFLDTFHHFPEVIEYRDLMATRWRLSLVTMQAAEPQRGLWQSDTTACCHHHKVQPLFAALADYDVWFTALRREQSPSRATLAHVEPFRLPVGREIRRVSPLAAWTTRDVWAYAKAHDIPLLPLYDSGYTSIGCEPCTSRPTDPANSRSGRWGGEKLECGIHIQAPATDFRGYD